MSGKDHSKTQATVPESVRNLQSKDRDKSLFNNQTKLQVKQIKFYFDPTTKSFNYSWFQDDEEGGMLKLTDLRSLMDELNGVSCYSHFRLSYFLGGVFGLILMFAGLVLGTSTVSKWCLVIALAGFAILVFSTFLSYKQTAQARKARKLKLLEILKKHEEDTFQRQGLNLKLGPGLSYIIIEVRQTTIFDDPDHQALNQNQKNQPFSGNLVDEVNTEKKIEQSIHNQNSGQLEQFQEQPNNKPPLIDNQIPTKIDQEIPSADLETPRKLQIPKPANQGPKVLDDSFDLQ